eukprot:6842369-Ditylum_brightwellii.AAC.1
MDRSPVSIVTKYDVLCGRGGKTNNHVGNVEYRSIVINHQAEYVVAKRIDKNGIARRIVQIVHERGGRFLKRAGGKATDVGCEGWLEIDEKKAIEKTSQALREKFSNQGPTGRTTKSKDAIKKDQERSSSLAECEISQTAENISGKTQPASQERFEIPPHPISPLPSVVTNHNDDTPQLRPVPASENIQNTIPEISLYFDTFGGTIDLRHTSNPSYLSDDTSFIDDLEGLGFNL